MHNGHKYEGQWKDDIYSGHGIYNYADDAVYSGNWANNRRNGQGTLTTHDGEKYVGQWKDDE